jgi:predicted O-methyltransferase YrrM
MKKTTILRKTMRSREKIPAALNYIYETVVHEPSNLQWVKERILATDWPIHIAPEEGRLLQLLIRLGGFKKILEIGTHAGYSTMWMAMALPEDGHIFTIERDQNRIRMARETFLHFENHNHQITLLEGKALDVLHILENKAPFDLIFIDADKLNYMNYLTWAEQHIRKGGLIIGDNTFLSGSVYGEPTTERISPSALKAVHAFNQRLGDQTIYSSVMLPSKEGWTMGIKK